MSCPLPTTSAGSSRFYHGRPRLCGSSGWRVEAQVTHEAAHDATHRLLVKEAVDGCSKEPPAPKLARNSVYRSLSLSLPLSLSRSKGVRKGAPPPPPAGSAPPFCLVSLEAREVRLTGPPKGKRKREHFCSITAKKIMLSRASAKHCPPFVIPF